MQSVNHIQSQKYWNKWHHKTYYRDKFRVNKLKRKSIISNHNLLRMHLRSLNQSWSCCKKNRLRFIKKCSKTSYDNMWAYEIKSVNSSNILSSKNKKLYFCIKISRGERVLDGIIIDPCIQIHKLSVWPGYFNDLQ